MVKWVVLKFSDFIHYPAVVIPKTILMIIIFISKCELNTSNEIMQTYSDFVSRVLFRIA